MGVFVSLASLRRRALCTAYIEGHDAFTSLVADSRPYFELASACASRTTARHGRLVR